MSLIPMAPYGVFASVVTSQQSTPKPHTSLLFENVADFSDSGAIHRAGLWSDVAVYSRSASRNTERAAPRSPSFTSVAFTPTRTLRAAISRCSTDTDSRYANAPAMRSTMTAMSSNVSLAFGFGCDGRQARKKVFKSPLTIISVTIRNGIDAVEIPTSLRMCSCLSECSTNASMRSASSTVGSTSPSNRDLTATSMAALPHLLPPPLPPLRSPTTTTFM